MHRPLRPRLSDVELSPALEAMLTVWAIVPAVSSLRLETDLALRLNLDQERQSQVATEQQAAVLTGTLEAENERIHKALATQH